MLCAAALVETCGDEPLVAAYGTEVAGLVRDHVPWVLFERGSRALPVDFRRCRSAACGDGSERGIVWRTDAGLPVTAFVRVIDCRDAGPGADGPRAGDDSDGPAPDRPDCSGPRAGNLYVQYWTYYADSATLRGAPVAGEAGYHRDDWEGAQLRIEPDGTVSQRATSHGGYRHARGAPNWGSDAGIGPLRDLAEAVGARPRGGWGAESRLLFVAGGSHAGGVAGASHADRLTPGHRIHLVPLEPIAAAPGSRHRFAVTPPWRKRVWLDPEAETTG